MSDTLNWDELDHSDDWPDRTTREGELTPDAEGQRYLEILEARLNAKADDPMVQMWADENLGENYVEEGSDGSSTV